MIYGILVIFSFTVLSSPVSAQYTRCANYNPGGRFPCTNILNGGVGYYNPCQNEPNNVCQECMDGAVCLGGTHQRCPYPAGGQCYMSEGPFGPFRDLYLTYEQYYYYQFWQCAAGCLDVQPCTVCSGQTYLTNCGGSNPGDCTPCSDCGPGSYYTDGCSTYALGGWPYDSVCALCPVGKYSDQVHNLACTQCPYGTTSIVEGAASLANCLTCPVGTYVNNLDGSCMNCLVGSYSNSAGMLSCILCPEGKYGPNSSLTACLSCLAGMYSTVLGAVDSSFCMACEPGTYTVTGQSCLQCPTGKYNPKSLATVCLNCPAGMYTAVPGAVESSLCVACAPGTYTVTGQSCLQCPVGKYNKNSLATTCISCPRGTYTNVLGAVDSTFCIPCDVGTFGTNNRCYDCGYSSYTSAIGATACEKCDAGKYQVLIKATSSSTCLKCNDGWYSIDYYSYCVRCAVGTFNYNAQKNNGTFCYSCAAGSYGTMRAATVCTACSAGTYNPLTQRTSAAACLACAAGTNSAAEAGICCPAGAYSAVSATFCCPVGTYSVISATACCSPDTFIVPPSTTCQACQAGSYIASSTSCLRCPNNTYSLKVSSLSCSSCAYCGVGSYAFACGNASAGLCTQCTF